VISSAGQLRKLDGEVSYAHTVLSPNDDEESIHAHHVPRRRKQWSRPVDEGKVVLAVEDWCSFVVDLLARSEDAAAEAKVVRRGVRVLPAVVDAQAYGTDLAVNAQGEVVDSITDLRRELQEERRHL